MKLNAKSLLLKIVVTASLGAMVGCGGTDPNDSAVAAANPTCKIKSNWLLLQKGYTIENTVRVLGQPNTQEVGSDGGITYKYEDCRIFLVEGDDGPTRELIEGSVSFSGGYLTTINSPKDYDGAFIREYEDAEVLTFDRTQLNP